MEDHEFKDIQIFALKIEKLEGENAMLQGEVDRITRERNDARYVAKLIAQVAGIKSDKIDWESVDAI